MRTITWVSCLAIIAVAVGLRAWLELVPFAAVVDQQRAAMLPVEPGARLDAVRLARALGFSQPRAATLAANSPLPAIRLLGTLRSSARSLAAIEEAEHTRTITVGDQLGAWTVSAVERTCLTLANGFDARQVCVSSAPGPRPVAPAAARSGEVTVPAAELKRIVEELAPIVMTTTQVWPVFREGALQGFGLAFGPTSPLRQYGLQTGDVIHAVNGQPVSFADAAKLFSQWQQLRSLELTVVRAGQPVSLRFAVE